MKRMMMIVAMMAVAAWVQAASFRPLTEQEQAAVGATHVATFTYSDMTETVTNTAMTFTNVLEVAAKERVELISMELTTAFNAGDNATGSVTVVVGDGTDTDLYLESAELDSNKTEIFKKFGRSAYSTTTAVRTNIVTVTGQYSGGVYTNYIAVTAQFSAVMTNANFDVTNLFQCVTNVAWTTVTYPHVCTNITTATETQTDVTALVDSTYGRKVYTAADTVDFIFTPNAENSLSENTAGEVKFYFKIGK